MSSCSSGDLTADRRFEYARHFAAAGDHAAALDLYRQTLELAPDWIPALIGLADAAVQLGNLEVARHSLHRAAERDSSGLHGAALKLAALSGLEQPSAPPEAYVRGLFDDYAARFDQALMGDLGYRVPERLGALLSGRHFTSVLDLGCGTGLMGEVLRPQAGHITGVDLSPQMIAQARAKHIYDRLEVDSIVPFMSRTEARYDLIVAADVFAYVGALEEVFAHASGLLRKGGLCAFTAEAAESEDFHLQESLRYAHARPYLEECAHQVHFHVAHIFKEPLRKDRGLDVDGWFVVMERSSGTRPD